MSLTGPPGIGKSRLAVEVVRKRERRGWEVAWVALAEAESREGLLAAMWRAVAPDRTAVEEDPEELSLVIGDRRLLLVADDCDHVIAPLAELAPLVLARCPEASFLTTSRQALGLAAERIWDVKPLSLPPASSRSLRDVREADAGALFLQRAEESGDAAGGATLDPPTVARVCRSLDGVPLAIELAAARLRVLTLRQIAERLDDGLELLAAPRARSPSHHRTMRAAVEWTFDRLPDLEAGLLRALSVVRGGCSIEAVEAIGSEDGAAFEGVLDGLAGLVDRSLVRMREWEGVARYSILEPVRRFALERLDASPMGWDGAARRHACFYLSLAEGAMARMEQLEPPPRLLAELDAELPNLRAALDWSETRDAGLMLRLHAALAWYWIASGRWLEGATRLQGARNATAEADDGVRARLLWGSASLAWLLHDVETAEACARDAVDAWRRVGRPQEVARSLALLAQVQADGGDEGAARSSSDEALTLARELSDPWVLTWVLACRGAVFRTVGELADAEAAYAELATRSRTPAALQASVWLLEAPLGRAAVAILDGDPGRAAVHALTAARAARAMDRRWYWARTLLAGAVVAARSGGGETAAACVGALDRLDAADTPLLRHEQVLLWELQRDLADELSPTAYDEARRAGAAMGEEGALRTVEAHLQTVVRDAQRWAPAQRTSRRSDAVASAPDLRVDALGPLEIRVGERPLADEDWSYAKPRELLVYLACHPQGRTREQVGLAFWPEASTAQVKNRFHVALHRVRRVLGDPRSVVVDRDRYRVNPDWVLALDAQRFEEQVRRVIEGPARGPLAPPARKALAGALALYRGDFLESEAAGDWHLERRDRYRNLFLRAQVMLAEALLEEGDWAAAGDGFEHMIRVDDLSEAGYRGLMRSRVAAGDRTGALRLYARLEAALREGLDAQPDASTRRLAEELREGG